MPTPASLFEDIRKAFMEHWNGSLDRLRCEKRGKHRHKVVLPCQGEGKGKHYYKWSGDLTHSLYIRSLRTGSQRSRKKIRRAKRVGVRAS